MGIKIHWKPLIMLITRIIGYPAYMLFIAFCHKHVSIVEAQKKRLSKLITKYCNTNLYGKKMCPMGIAIDHFRGDVYSVIISRRVHETKSVARWERHFKTPHTSDYDVCEAVREGLIELYELKPGKDKVRV